MMRMWQRLGWLGSALCIMASTSASAAEPKVVVTIKPVHSLAAAVMAGVAEPKLLIEGTASPHTFALKPSDAKLINEAQLLVRVSEGLEPFTGKLIKSLPKSVRVATLASTEKLTLLPMREGGPFEAHDHGHGGKGGHKHGHSHGGSSKKKTAEAEMDGHIWLDPQNAKLIADVLAKELSVIAPAHAETFRRNADALTKRLDELDAELAASIKPAVDKPYIVFHDAYQYFERRYGLTPAGSVTVNPDVPPSAKRLSDLRRKIASLKATCVFAEPQFAPKVIDTIVEGTSARRGVLDPLGSAAPAGPEQYFATLRGLAGDLRSCLASPA